MDEILRSNKHVHDVCESMLLVVAAVFIATVAAAVWLAAGIAGARMSWPVLALIPVIDIAAIVASALVQRRAVNRHNALCDAYAAALTRR